MEKTNSEGNLIKRDSPYQYNYQHNELLKKIPSPQRQSGLDQQINQVDANLE